MNDLAKPDTGGPRTLLLNRERAALYLTTVYGARISADTLARMAMRDTGPPFRLLGRSAVYEPDDLDAWARGRLSPKVHSNSGLSRRDPFYRRNGGARPFAPAVSQTEGGREP